MPVPLSVFAGLTGRVIVRLAQELVPRLRERIDADLPDLTDLGQLASALHLSGLSALLSNPAWQPELQTSPTFPVSTARILQLEAEARQRDIFPPLHSLTSYWTVDVRGLTPSDRLEFALALRQTPSVELVYFEPQFSDPTVPVGSNPCIGQQGYLDAAPKGIDARAAWTAGFDGTGVTFIDLERYWQWEHTDLTGPPLNLSDASVKGVNPRPTDVFSDHGTHVLGVVVAHDNGVFGIGIAPNPGLVELVAWNRSKWDVAESILQATLRDPDVLLLEVQTGLEGDTASHYPVEVTEACFDAIRLASGVGITVIEPAGNSDHDLDRGGWDSAVLGLPGANRNKLERGGDNDSGAILVAAAQSAVLPHPRSHMVDPYGRPVGSNYGARIDCYAWGDSVETTGNPETRGGPNDWNPRFGGTSAASAIVAGAAVLTHQMYRKTFLSRLSPPQARQLLSNPAIGTKCRYLCDHTDFPIGVMPDLAKIISAVGAVADVYVRDSLADTGAVPNAALGQSPDIFVVRAGRGAALAGLQPTDDGPPRTVLQGFAHEVYVRAFNRSGSPAQPTAQVYWTEPATYLDPADWNNLGTTAAFPVPAGANALSPPLSWPAGSAAPAGDHGCFVAILDDPSDAAPGIPATFYNDPTWFQTFLSHNNNVAFRNFSVVDLTIFLAQVALPDLLIRGLRRRVFSYDLELTHDLPPGARLVLRSSDDERAVPPFLTGMGGTREEPLPRHVTWRDLSLGARQEARVRFHLLLSEPLVGGPFTIRVRQLYRGTQAGRYTWLLQTRP